MSRFWFAASLIGAAATFAGCVAQYDGDSGQTRGDDTPLQLETAQGTPEADDVFGAAVVTGDFDGDGRDDLAVAAPNEKPGSGVKTGSVILYHGTASGLKPWMHLDGSSLPASASGDQFGYSLATIKRVTQNQCDDLIVGAPGAASTAGGPRGGVVWVFPCVKSDGVSVGRHVQITQAKDSGGVINGGDRFGASLATTTISGNGKKFLAVGSPGENNGTSHSTGYAFVYSLSTTGATPTVGLFGRLQNPEIHEEGVYGQFGHAVAIGDLNGDGAPDLAVGNFNALSPGYDGLDLLFMNMCPRTDNQCDTWDSSVWVAMGNNTSGYTTAHEFNDPIAEVAPVRNRFGYSLAIGPVASEAAPALSQDRLIVGVPGAPASCGGWGGALLSYEWRGGGVIARSAPFSGSCQSGQQVGWTITTKPLTSSPAELHTVFSSSQNAANGFQTFRHDAAGWTHSGGGAITNPVSDSHGNIVPSARINGWSIAVGDYRGAGHKDAVLGIPYYSTPTPSIIFNGGFGVFVNSGSGSSNVWIIGSFFDEATDP